MNLQESNRVGFRGSLAILLVVGAAWLGCSRKDPASDSAGSTGGATGTATGNGVEVPVPVFLADPGSSLSDASQALAGQELAGTATDTGSADGSSLGYSSAEGSRSVAQALLASLLTDLNQSLEAIIKNAFSGKAVQVPSGTAALFDVSAQTFPATLPVRYVKVSTATAADLPTAAAAGAALSYFELQGYCSSASAYSECLRVYFTETNDNTAGPAQLWAQTPDKTAGATGSWELTVAYGAGSPLNSAFRHNPPLVGALGLTVGFTTKALPDGSLVTWTQLAEAAGKSPLLYPQLPRSRADDSARQVGDLTVYQSLRPAAGTALARRVAFVPVAERGTATSVATTVFASDGMDVYAGQELSTVLRGTAIDKSCSTAGQQVRAAFSGATPPASVAALPDDLCTDDAALTDAALLAALTDLCGTGAELSLPLKFSQLANAPDVDADVCGYTRAAILRARNPQVFTGLLYTDQVPPPAAVPDALAPLAAALAAEVAPIDTSLAAGLATTTFEAPAASAFSGAVAAGN